jgi:hypothetical protein
MCAGVLSLRLADDEDEDLSESAGMILADDLLLVL